MGLGLTPPEERGEAVRELVSKEKRTRREVRISGALRPGEYFEEEDADDDDDGHMSKKIKLIKKRKFADEADTDNNTDNEREDGIEDVRKSLAMVNLYVVRYVKLLWCLGDQEVR